MEPQSKGSPESKGTSIAPLLSQLREHASALPEREREVALEHLDKLHTEAATGRGDTIRMKVWLKGLETFPSLAPIIAEVLDALASVGA